MQYTFRGFPAHSTPPGVNAPASGQSLNEAAIDALAEGIGLTGVSRKRRSLADIAGTWKADKAFEDAISVQDRIDEDLWK